MLKSSILNYHASFKNSIRSSWSTLGIISAIVIPSTIFLLLLFFETEAAAVLMTFYPPSVRQGVTFYLDIIHLTRTEILWLGSFTLLTLVLMTYPSGSAMTKFFSLRSKTRTAYFMMLIGSVFYMSTIFVNNRVLEDFPNSSDEYAYLFQAEMFSRGKWWERAHDLPDFFYHNNIAQHDGILVSRFPPGWPLLLSSAFEIAMDPSLVNPLLGLITLVLFYFFVRKYYGHAVALWSMFAAGLTGFYMFNSASYFSHISCFLVTLLFVFNVYLYGEKKSIVYGLLAGFFLGFIVLIRYYTALLIFAPFAVYILKEYRWSAVRLFLWIALGSIPCLAFLMWYNYSITGNVFLPVTVWAYPDEQIGFVRGHTVLKGAEHLIRRILLFIYWTSPGLLVLYAVFLWRKLRTPAERLVQPEDYAFLALVIGYFFYYEIGGNQYGPRFYFEGFPFMVVFVVSKVLKARERWASALLIACMVHAVAKVPFIAYRESRIIDQRQDMYDLVQDQKITNAVVFVSSPTSPWRPMPADDLTRNDPKFMNDVIYVRTLPKINQQVMEYYGDRSFYKYVRDVDSVHGELIKIR